MRSSVTETLIKETRACAHCKFKSLSNVVRTSCEPPETWTSMTNNHNNHITKHKRRTTAAATCHLSFMVCPRSDVPPRSRLITIASTLRQEQERNFPAILASQAHSTTTKRRDGRTLKETLMLLGMRFSSPCFFVFCLSAILSLD